MRHVVLTIASVCWIAAAVAQQAPATLTLSAARLNEIALRFAAPDSLPEALARELEQTVRDLERARVDAALPHWREFLRRRELLTMEFDPAVYVDCLLHRIAAARSKAAAEASRRLQFYDAQETAVFEHVSTVDKQISIYAGEDKPQVPLREPQLAEFAEGAAAVTLAPAETVGMKELIASLHRWRDRAPAISEARAAARDEFTRAIAADGALGEELHTLDRTLRAEIKTIVVREAR